MSDAYSKTKKRKIDRKSCIETLCQSENRSDHICDLVEHDAPVVDDAIDVIAKRIDEVIQFSDKYNTKPAYEVYELPSYELKKENLLKKCCEIITHKKKEDFDCTGEDDGNLCKLYDIFHWINSRGTIATKLAWEINRRLDNGKQLPTFYAPIELNLMNQQNLEHIINLNVVIIK